MPFGNHRHQPSSRMLDWYAALDACSNRATRRRQWSSPCRDWCGAETRFNANAHTVIVNSLGHWLSQSRCGFHAAVATLLCLRPVTACSIGVALGHASMLCCRLAVAHVRSSCVAELHLIAATGERFGFYASSARRRVLDRCGARAHASMRCCRLALSPTYRSPRCGAAPRCHR